MCRKLERQVAEDPERVLLAEGVATLNSPEEQLQRVLFAHELVETRDIREFVERLGSAMHQRFRVSRH
jgi:hypothetical protein